MTGYGRHAEPLNKLRRKAILTCKPLNAGMKCTPPVSKIKESVWRFKIKRPQHCNITWWMSCCDVVWHHNVTHLRQELYIVVQNAGQWCTMQVGGAHCSPVPLKWCTRQTSRQTESDAYQSAHHAFNMGEQCKSIPCCCRRQAGAFLTDHFVPNSSLSPWNLTLNMTSNIISNSDNKSNDKTQIFSLPDLDL